MVRIEPDLNPIIESSLEEAGSYVNVTTLDPRVIVQWFYKPKDVEAQLPKKLGDSDLVMMKRAFDKRVYLLGSDEDKIVFANIKCRRSSLNLSTCSDQFTDTITPVNISGLCSTIPQGDGEDEEPIFYRWTYWQSADPPTVVSVFPRSPFPKD